MSFVVLKSFPFPLLCKTTSVTFSSLQGAYLGLLRNTAGCLVKRKLVHRQLCARKTAEKLTDVAASLVEFAA